MLNRELNCIRHAENVIKLSSQAEYITGYMGVFTNYVLTATWESCKLQVFQYYNIRQRHTAVSVSYTHLDVYKRQV